VRAKKHSDAEDILRIVHEELAKGNDLGQEIAYRTTGANRSIRWPRFSENGG
jgi:hypothetical protein